MTEMKPCPFCGGEVELRDKLDRGYGDETSFILCTKCHMWFEKFDYRGMDHKSIIEEWNKRVEVLADIKPCPFCGCEMRCVQFTYGAIGSGWIPKGEHSAGCVMNRAYFVSGSKEDVIEGWNRRATGSESLRDTIKRYREKCGEPVVDDRTVE